MLKYTLNSLNKSGFFLLGYNKTYNYNMSTFIWCSRNSFGMVDIVQFVFFFRKFLYLFQNIYLKRCRILFFLEDELLHKVTFKLFFKFFVNIKNIYYNSFVRKNFFLNEKITKLSKKINSFSISYNFFKKGLLNRNFFFQIIKRCQRLNF